MSATTDPKEIRPCRKKNSGTHYAGKRRSLNAVAATAHSKREGFMVAVTARTLDDTEYSTEKLKRLRYDTTLLLRVETPPRLRITGAGLLRRRRRISPLELF